MTVNFWLQHWDLTWTFKYFNFFFLLLLDFYLSNSLLMLWKICVHMSFWTISILKTHYYGSSLKHFSFLTVQTSWTRKNITMSEIKQVSNKKNPLATLPGCRCDIIIIIASSSWWWLCSPTTCGRSQPFLAARCDTRGRRASDFRQEVERLPAASALQLQFDHLSVNRKFKNRKLETKRSDLGRSIMSCHQGENFWK